MKKIKLLISILFIITAFSLTSCGEDEPLDGYTEGTDSNAVSGSFKVDFNGATWTATKIQASIYNNEIVILAEKPNGENFIIGVLEAKTGTYPANVHQIAYGPSGSLDSYWSLNQDNLEENTGSVTISSINTENNTISGTFNFKGYWDGDGVKAPIEFTKGEFKNITFTREDPSSPASGSDTFYAKLEGAEFVENKIDVAYVEASGVAPYYSIMASKTNGDNVGVKISKSLSVGTYTITGAFGRDVSGVCYIGDKGYNSDSGSVTIISKTTTHMTGTFNFVASNFSSGDTKIISEGTFSVELVN